MARVETPPDDPLRCEALVSDMYQRPTELRCGFYAKVLIGGRRLCARHGANHALELALKARTATALPRVVPEVDGVVRPSRFARRPRR